MNEKTFNDRIEKISERLTRDGRPYLIIKTAKEALSLFAFSNKVPQSDWESLREGLEYSFTVEENALGNLVLTEFQEEQEEIFI